ncbi:glycoside hydrolase family 97 protein [Sphingosinicella sp. LHD-64]|uniref:glycoside hydrolase family 97 protein n=1 Tax=Sphingosinicella sp. LHD-64 TaxID=3072139 RepID=UPI00280C4916|nr:glycoside hydrolase family 97 protein [Sphingosinicella sp. LHD-64]MDQ8756786.1 glycoside hydrolase family 97 protein [Sphingosinicella sp. LHD-64]
MIGRLIALLTLLLAAPASAETVARIASPGGVLSAELQLDPEGRPSYSVQRLGREIIAPSRLGFLLLNAPKLERNFALDSQSTRSFDETWEQPWGERRFVRNHYNELRVRFTERTGLARSLDVVFRVFDDGIGFRYEFPEQPNLANVEIQDELTEFAVADPGTAWWIPAFEWNREEYLYNRTPISAVGTAQTPMTVRTDNGLHIAFHEAALIDYSGMNLASMGHGRFRAALTPGTDGAKVRRQAPFPTPWRTLQVADSAGGLAMSNLILNLNEPNRLGDVSWVRPMKYVGVWWEMHLDRATWASGDRHGATTANVRRHVDFAAANGFDGVLVEGWNVGWDGDWFGNGQEFSFTRPYPDFDLEGLAAYARRRGVQLIGHHETSGFAAHYEDQMEDAFSLYQRLGVHAVKTGYVADAGQAKVRGADGRILYAWHEGQAMNQHHMRVIEAAARHRISVNAHEPTKDTGLRRTYPNIIAREGARGMEYSAWGNPSNPPEHEANLVFTRMLAGPMDYTPGIFGMRTRSPQGVQTTWAKQLALYVIIYSPLQMAADLLENYEANPRPFQFIRDVPVDWSESLVLNGEIGDYVTIARKDRASENWYLGAVTDEEGRVLNASLGFLTPGRRYRAQIYRDGPNADYRANPGDIAIEERIVTSTDTLTLRLAPGGGQAIRLVALGR